jgi:microcystin-dependent protein
MKKQLGVAPTNATDATTKGYVDSVSGAPDTFFADLGSATNSVDWTTAGVDYLSTVQLGFTSSGLTLHSLEAGANRKGRPLTIQNLQTSGGPLTIAYYSPSAVLYNKFNYPGGFEGYPIVLQPGEAATFVSTGSGGIWTLVSQGHVTTSSPAGNAVVSRDAAGRAQVVSPSAGSDIANKGYADALGTSAVTTDTIMRRDAAGRAQVVSPSAGSDIANKTYVDNSLTVATSWKTEVKVASTANINLSAPGSTIDGISMVLSDRFLAKNQTTPAQNGVYLFEGSGNPATRVSDMNSAGSLNGAVVYVKSGTNANTTWRQSATIATLGTTAVTFTPFSDVNATPGTLAQRNASAELISSTPGSSSPLTSVATKEYVDAGVPPGVIQMWPASSPPSGWWLCDGQAVSRGANSTLFTTLNPSLGAVTISIATPGVVTRTAHGLYTGQMVYFTTTGALPSGLTAATVAYYVIRVDANTFRLATSQANANLGTAITTSGTQSGTHTLRTTFGVGDGSTTFNVPNFSGRIPVGLDTTQEEFNAVGETGGAKTHTHTSAAHTHPLSAAGQALVSMAVGVSPPVYLRRVASSGSWTATHSIPTAPSTASNSASTGAELAGDTDSTTPAATGSSSSLQPYVVVNYIIKS